MFKREQERTKEAPPLPWLGQNGGREAAGDLGSLAGATTRPGTDDRKPHEVPPMSRPPQHAGHHGKDALHAAKPHHAPQQSAPKHPAAKKKPGFDLVALDIDGTLLRSDKRLAVKTCDAVKAAMRRGVKVVLASARPPRSVKEIYKHLALNTLQINYNGALIHDPVAGKHVYHQPLDAGLATRIVKIARKLDPKVVVSVEILDKWYTDHTDDTLPTETSKAFTPDFIGPLEAFLHVNPTKLMLLAPRPRLDPIIEAVQTKFAGQIGLAISDEHLLQVIHHRADKSVALAMVAQQYGVAWDRVMAIGDAPNDVGMLKWAGLGVAMGNAWGPVREAADVIVPDNDDDGVAHAIEHYVLT